MDDYEYNAKLEELDHLLNDDVVEIAPNRVWSLLMEVSQHDLHGIPAA